MSVQFATKDELDSFLGRVQPDSARANLILQMVSADMQVEARQTLALVEDHTIQVRPQWDRHELVLPERPVLEVTEILLGETEIGGFDVKRRGLVTWGVGSFLDPVSADGLWPASVSVTYSHGYALIADDIPDPNLLGITLLPADLKAVCLQAAARRMSNPTQRASEQMVNVSVRHADPGWLPEERAVLHRYRP